MNVINRETVEKQIRPLLQFTKGWRIQVGNLEIASGVSQEEFDEALDLIENTFQGQVVSLKMGDFDRNGKLKSKQNFQFVLSENMDGSQDQGSNIILSGNQPQSSPFLQLSGIPGQAANAPVTMEQLNGLVDAQATRIGEGLKADFAKKQAEMEAGFEKRMAEMERERILADAQREKERVMDEIQREREKLQEEKNKLIELEKKFDEKQEGDLRTAKGIMKGLGGLIMDFGKDYIQKDKKEAKGEGLRGTQDIEKNNIDYEEVEETGFEEVIEDFPEDTKINNGEGSKTKLALINERAQEIREETGKENITWSEAQKQASEEINLEET